MKSNVLIIGRGEGLSKILASHLKSDSIAISELDFSEINQYENLIITSSDPSFEIVDGSYKDYINKNFTCIAKISSSDYKGRIIYISSIDSGSYSVYDKSNTTRNLYTPYSFSKDCAEGLLKEGKGSYELSILRLGLLWPGKKNCNLNKACNGQHKNISISPMSKFYITPYSLVIHCIDNIIANELINNRRNTNYLCSEKYVEVSELLSENQIKGIPKDLFCYLPMELDEQYKMHKSIKDYKWSNYSDYSEIINNVLSNKGERYLR